MTSYDQLKRRVDAFRDFLASRGAEVLEPTNEWEVVRFLAGGETGVVYRNKVGRVRFTGPAETAYNAYLAGQPWRAVRATRRPVAGRRAPKVAALLARDGPLCFFCQLEMSEDNQSLEHLVGVTAGGPNHISNLFLAHKICNSDAGHLSAPEKIKRHVAAVIARRLEGSG